MLEGACRGAECRDPELISFLRQQPPPLEFTFMREPMGYLISAAAQALRLIVNYDCVDRADRPWAWRAPDSAADVVRVLQFALTDDLWATGGLGSNRSNMIGIGRNARRQEIYRKQCNNKEVANARVVLRSAVRHVFPQTAGYGWDPEQGVKRLHFVGRTEAFAADWRRLLQQLGHDSKAVSVAQLKRPVNPRTKYLNASLRYLCPEYRGLAAHPLVREWFAADRCFLSPCGIT